MAKGQQYQAPHACRGCSARWGGALYCHCTRCHRTFATVKAFDKHILKNGMCAAPDGLGMQQDESGVWK